MLLASLAICCSLFLLIIQSVNTVFFYINVSTLLRQACLILQILLPSLAFFSTDRNIDGSEYTSELVLLLHFPPTLIIMQIFFLSVKKRDTEKRRAKRKIILSDTYMQITYSAAPFFAPFCVLFCCHSKLSYEYSQKRSRYIFLIDGVSCHDFSLRKKC